MFTIIFRYISYRYLITLCALILALTILILLLKSYSLFKSFNVVDIYHLSEVIIYLIPKALERSIPLAVLLSIIIFLGNLSYHSELLICNMANLSPIQLMKPIAILTLLLMICEFFLIDSIRPNAYKKIENLLINNKFDYFFSLLPNQFHQIDNSNLTIFFEDKTKDFYTKFNSFYQPNTNKQNYYLLALNKLNYHENNAELLELNKKAYRFTSNEGGTLVHGSFANLSHSEITFKRFEYSFDQEFKAPLEESSTRTLSLKELFHENEPYNTQFLGEVGSILSIPINAFIAFFIGYRLHSNNPYNRILPGILLSISYTAIIKIIENTHDQLEPALKLFLVYHSILVIIIIWLLRHKR